MGTIFRKMDWEKFSFVWGSEARKKILLILDEEKTPTELSKKLDYRLPHTSRALRQLEEKELVECLTPDKPRDRFYRRTKEGTEIAEKIQERE